MMIDKYPNVMTKTSGLMRSSDYQKVKEIEDLSSKWITADQNNRERLFNALRGFLDVNGGLWDKESLARMKQEGRHPASFPIAEQKIRTLAGSIQSEKFDYKYEPLYTEETYLTQNIKHWYYADKEQNNYSLSENKALIRGLIHTGIEEMVIDYSIRRTGSISFIPTLPGMVLKDPYWMSDILKDWRKAIKHAWMTPQEIIDKYDTDDSDIRRLAELDMISGYDYEQTGEPDVFKDVPYTYGSKMLVIEFRYLEKFKSTRLHLCLEDGTILPLPVKANESEVRNYMAMYGVDSWEKVREYPYEDNILYLTTVCPQASKTAILFDGKHDIQCEFIGFFPFSSCREMGIDKGIYESLLDLNRTLNYREAKKDDIIASAIAGAKAVDIDALPEGKKQLAEIKQNITRPDYVLGVHGDPRKVISEMPKGDVNPAIINDIMSLVDMMDRVSPVVPALEGAATKDESGILFEMRHAVAKLGTLILYDNWTQHLMNKAEAWYNQSQITYKNQYKKVKNTDSGGFVEFNSPDYQNGQRGYKNSLDELPRARVIVSLSKWSPSEQVSKRFQYLDMAKIYSAHPELFTSQIRLLANKTIETIDLEPQEKDFHKMLSTIQMQSDLLKEFNDLESLKANILNSKVMQEQSMGILRQMNAQMSQVMNQQGPQLPEQRSPVIGETVNEQTYEAPIETESAPGAPVETSRGTFEP